ncbi:unnamed protein product [Mytilus coruscus]|uniref:VWFA domain-containing protein n=1 Tax=Mytilus coruscus TaxID=42192 RepID=A0A6J8AXI5_MYTCO|nr:unnamed protein product [Mytilus coruscus]
MIHVTSHQRTIHQVIRDGNQVGISSYLSDDLCNITSEDFTPNHQGWKSECDQALSLPVLPNTAVCVLEDTCTSVKCCMDVGFLKKSFSAFVEIDTCNHYLKFGIEKLTKHVDLFNYHWGTLEKKNLMNVIRIEYKIEDISADQEYEIDLNMSVCFESHKSCFFSMSFSLTKLLEEQKETLSDQLPTAVRQILLEKLGLSDFLLDSPCNVSTNPFVNECTSSYLTLTLPSSVSCVIPPSCSALSCCMDVQLISRAMMYEIHIDPCTYTMSLTIEKLHVKMSLLKYIWGETHKFSLQGGIIIKYRVFDLKSEKMFIVDLSFHICMEEKEPNSCIVDLPILTNAKLVKPLCNWNMGFSQSDFSLATWLTENSITDTGTLQEVFVAQLLYKLGVYDYMKDPQCDRNQPPYQPANNNGWNLNKCNDSVDIPLNLPAGISCYLSDTCTGIDCCIQVDKLGLSVNAYVLLDACHNTFTVGVENFKHTTTMLDIDLGEIQTFSMMGFVRVSYKIDEFYNERMFIVSLTISICYEANGPCALEMIILENTKLPIPLCDFSQGIPGFSFAAWVDNNKIDLGEQLQSYDVDRLMEELGIAGYLLNPQCQVSAYQAEANGWNTGSCDADLSLPTLPSNMACWLPDYCTGIQCCLYIPLLDMSVEFHVLVDVCNLKLSIGLENLVINESLSDYSFNTEKKMSLGSIIRLSYSIEDLAAEEKLSFSLTVNFCFESDGDCRYNYVIFEDYKISKQPCDWTGGFAVPNFILNSWLTDHDLSPSLSKLSDLMASKLLEDLGIAEYLQEPSCNPATDIMFSNVQSNGWYSACLSAVLPSLADNVVCHLDSTCTSVTCCAPVGLINRNIHFFLTVDPCNQTFSLGIEKYQFEFSLYETDFNLQKQFHIGRVLEIDYKISDMVGERVYYVDLSIKVCFNDGGPCLIQANIFSNTKLPKVQCSWQKGFFDPDWSLSNWYDQTGFQLKGRLTADEISQLMFDIGLSKFLYNDKCDYTDPESVFVNAYHGWTSDCSDSKIELSDLPEYLTCYLNSVCFLSDCSDSKIELPDLPDYLTCYADSTCFSDCPDSKIELPDLPDYLTCYLNSICFLSDCSDSKIELPDLPDYLTCYADSTCLFSDCPDSKIELPDLPEYLTCYLNSVCFLSDCSDSKIELPDLPDYLTCYADPICFLSDCSDSKIELPDLPDYLTCYLDSTYCPDSKIELPDLPDYLTCYADSTCLFSDCPDSKIELPDLPDYLTCYLDSTCMGIQCCWDVDFISRSIHSYLTVDTCNYILKFGVEKLEFEVTLDDYEWGEWKQFDLYGVMTVRCMIDDLPAQHMYLFSMTLSLCWESDGQDCDQHVILNNVLLPKPNCNWNKPYSIPGCKAIKPADIVFVVDESGSVGEDNFIDTMDAIADTIDTLVIREDLIRVGMTLFEGTGTSRTLFVLNSSYNKSEIRSWLLSADYRKGATTDIADAFQFACEEMFQMTKGERTNAQNYLVLLTDGRSDQNKAIDKAALCSSKNVRIITVGIGSGIDVDLLNTTAYQPDYFINTEYSELNTTLPELVTKSVYCTKDFSLADFLSDSRLSTLDSLAVSKLMDYLGLSEYLLSEQCDTTQLPYNTSVNGWTYDCSVPDMIDISPYGECYIPHTCTSIDCCVNLPGLHRNIHASVDIDTCNYKLTVDIEKVHLEYSLVDYEWGHTETYSLFGLFNVVFTVQNLVDDKLLVTMDISVCMERAGPCEVILNVFKDTRLPKPVCNWKNGFIVPDFSLKNFLSSKGLSSTLSEVSSEVILQLSNKLGIASFYVENQCNRADTPFIPNQDGWKNDCSGKVNLPALPNGTTCQLSDDCTGVTCCTDVDPLSRSISTSLKLDPCEYTLQVQIEKLIVNISLLDYQFGKEDGLYLFGVIRLDYDIDDLRYKRQYVVNIHLSVCFEATGPCAISIPVLTNAILPKSVCDWKSNFIDPEFSLLKFKKDEYDLHDGDSLTDYQRKELMDKLGVTDFINHVPCSSGKAPYAGSRWTNDCDTLTSDLPLLPGTTVCHIQDTCTSVSCCFSVDKIRQSFQASVDIDPCRSLLTFTIDKFTLQKNLLDFQWGTPVEMWLFGLLRLELTVNDLESEGNYLVDMILKACLDADVSIPCYQSIEVFKDYKLPKSVCDWNYNFPVEDFIMGNWITENDLSSNVDLLPQWAVLQLMQMWGISRFVSDSACSTLQKETSSDCILSVPDLPDWLFCSVPSVCNGIECCVDLPSLNKSVAVALRIENCRNTLQLQIGEQTTKIKLNTFEFDKNHSFSLFGIVKVIHNTTDRINLQHLTPPKNSHSTTDRINLQHLTPPKKQSQYNRQNQPTTPDSSKKQSQQNRQNQPTTPDSSKKQSQHNRQNQPTTPDSSKKQYEINALEIKNQYGIDLNISVCYSDTLQCDYNVQLWSDTVINGSGCELASGFLSSGWLTKSNTGDSHAYCKLCNKDFRIDHGGLNDVNKHTNTAMHIKNLQAQNSTKSASNFFTRPDDDGVTKAEVVFAYSIAEHNIPFSYADHFTKLCKVMFPDSKIATKFACGRTKATQIVKRSLAPTLQQDVIINLRTQPFSLTIDESNDRNTDKCLAILVRYFTSDSAKTRLLTMPICNI